MSGETQVDREAAAARVRGFLDAFAGRRGIDPEEIYSLDGGVRADGESLLVSDLLALIPAPHPQGGTEALRAAVETLCDKAERHAWQEDDRWVSERDLRALLAAAPAPTEGDPYCICGGGADHDDDCPRADEAP